MKRTSPDWMMGYISQSELQDPGALDQVYRNMRALNPRLGMCLVLVDGNEACKPENLPDNICAISVGFDQSRLASVVDALLG
jgi:hypothetical protein